MSVFVKKLDFPGTESFLAWIWIRIRTRTIQDPDPYQHDKDPDPYQHDKDPQHCS